MSCMVAGYFDGLHPGHLEFLRLAANYGPVTVAVGSDARHAHVKGRLPRFNQVERISMLQSCAYVARVELCTAIDGEGGVVWEDILKAVNPQFFIVNNDIPTDWRDHQKHVCDQHGVHFIELRREPGEGMRPWSSTQLTELPYRVVLTTWLDQLTLTQLAHGPCVGFSILPTMQFGDREGMATSTRQAVRRIWPLIPNRDPAELARIVFATENAPQVPIPPRDGCPWGSYAAPWIAGAVDPLTLLHPGVTVCYYEGGAWPRTMHITDPDILDWLEQVVTLQPTQPRLPGLNFNLVPNMASARCLAHSSHGIVKAILAKDTRELADCMDECVDHISAMSNYYLSNGVEPVLKQLRKNVAGCFVQGAGGGGYIACVDDDPGDRIRIKIRRPE